MFSDILLPHLFIWLGDILYSLHADLCLSIPPYKTSLLKYAKLLHFTSPSFWTQSRQYISHWERHPLYAPWSRPRMWTFEQADEGPFWTHGYLQQCQCQTEILHCDTRTCKPVKAVEDPSGIRPTQKVPYYSAFCQPALATSGCSNHRQGPHPCLQSYSSFCCGLHEFYAKTQFIFQNAAFLQYQ